MSKILYMFDAGDWGSRMELAKAAHDQGHDVVIGLINAAEDAQTKPSNFKVIPLQKSSGTFGPIAAIMMIKHMAKLIRSEAPDVIHVVTLKYSFLAGIACIFRTKIRKIFTLAGLGYVFRSYDLKSKILRFLLRPLLTLVLRKKNTALIFQNQDDLNLMVDNAYARPDQCTLIKGSGVYLNRFTPKPSQDHNKPLVLMPTRLVHEKGITVFVAAARILKARGIEARFEIAGGETKHNPRAISRAEMEDLVKDGTVTWLGRVSNMPDLLSRATLIVYPSYYGEGIPRVLLESCAAGRAIITTDHPGCREAVHDGKNGLLVPIKDAKSTANAIETLLQDTQMRCAMEVESRKKAEAEFNIHTIVAQTLQLYP